LSTTGIYVVMGVAGSGKTVIGTAFARALGVEFVEGDEYHPPRNIERMSRGIPLTDADRAGWLEALAIRIGEAKESGAGLVVACSALKRSYRDILRRAAPDLRFVFLHGGQDLIAARMASRKQHFMPASLLASQLATLEEPAADEDAWVCDINLPPDRIIAQLLARAAG
jgi:gluconokinase